MLVAIRMSLPLASGDRVWKIYVCIPTLLNVVKQMSLRMG